MPKRIQRKRTKGWRLPPNTLCVTRPGKWGNPYSVQAIGMTEWTVRLGTVVVGSKTRSRSAALTQCLDMYRAWATLQMAADPQWLEPLRGRDLCCWCATDVCHATVLLELANR